MPSPQFTVQEQYLIDNVKAGCRGWNVAMLAYVGLCTAMCAFGAWQNSVPLLVVAVLVVCLNRVLEYWDRSSTWLPIWRSIIEKYETAALAPSPTNGLADSPGMNETL